jgi:hypothetical protein
MVEQHFISFRSCMKSFRESISGTHIQTPWSERVRLTLQFVAQHPEHLPRIGLISCGYNSILVNARIFGEFIGVKPNSINRNFTQHGFILDPKCDVTQELRTLSPKLARMSRSWCKRVYKFGPFNARSTPEDAERMSAYAHNFRCGFVQADDAQYEADSQQPSLQWDFDFGFGIDHSDWSWSSSD